MSLNTFLLAIAFFVVAAAVPGQSTKKNAPTQKSAASESVANGKKIYDAQCEICHFAGSTKKKIGPGLKGLYKYGKFANGKTVDDESLRVWIEKGGKDMPGFKDTVNAPGIRDLIAFIKTL